ncbi:MAG: hypothetical protein ABI339_10490 [Solirubrobacteraceae bacterium]
MQFHRDEYVFLSRPGSAPVPRRPRQVPVRESTPPGLPVTRTALLVRVVQRVRVLRAVTRRRVRAADAEHTGRRLRGR